MVVCLFLWFFARLILRVCRTVCIFAFPFNPTHLTIGCHMFPGHLSHKCSLLSFYFWVYKKRATARFYNLIGLFLGGSHPNKILYFSSSVNSASFCNNAFISSYNSGNSFIKSPPTYNLVSNQENKVQELYKVELYCPLNKLKLNRLSG